MSETRDGATTEERTPVIDHWHVMARQRAWDADGDVLYWAAVDAIAWALIEATMDTSDRQPTEEHHAAATRTAERILLTTRTDAP